MRLATRTGLAAFAASFLSLAAIGAVLQGVSSRILLDRVDDQLRARAETAPVLAAVAERLGRSELSGTLEGARVAAQGRTVELGSLPQEPLPPLAGPGWATAPAGGERWRLYTVEVRDVPEVGDEALVQLVAPLGDTEAAVRRIRRRALVVGLVATLGAGLVGYLLGSVASRPLTALRRDTARLDDAAPRRWRVAGDYGSPEVDEVAATLNHSLGRLADETERRGAALESARAFASAANHELRAPLQTAMTNLNLASAAELAAEEHQAVLARATAAVSQTASALAAVRTLAEAEFADPSWFVPTDLAELVEAAVAAETRRGEVSVELVAPAGPEPDVALWAAGVQLAVANVVRNAVVHGRPAAGAPARLQVEVAGATVTVDDNGPGVAPGDRLRVVERFQRGSRAEGSGLGLAIAAQVTRAHGGGITLTGSPLGGTRVELRFAPPTPGADPRPTAPNRESNQGPDPPGTAYRDRAAEPFHK